MISQIYTIKVDFYQFNRSSFIFIIWQCGCVKYLSYEIFYLMKILIHDAI